MTMIHENATPCPATEPRAAACAYRQPLTSISDIDGIARGLADDGYALIPGVLSPGEISDLRSAIDRLTHFGLDSVNEHIDHYKCVFNRDRAFLPFLDPPGIIDAAERMMGDQCHIIGMTAWRSRPGYHGCGVHLDHVMMTLPESTFQEPSFELPMWIGTVHYYLEDISPDLCPTYIIPGSHRAGRPPRQGEETWRGHAAQPVLCQAGDALFFRSEVWHSGSNNTTATTTRYLLQVHYANRAVAQKFSPWPFQYNPEILALATPRQLRILGKHPASSYG